MRPSGVVLAHPSVDDSLRGSQVRERHGVIEELAAQAAVEPLDLARGGGMAGLGQPVNDPVVPADPVEQHLPALPETISKLLAIVSEHLPGHPELAQRGGERQANRPARRPHHDLADHAEPGMIIHPGHQLRLGSVGQEDPAHQIHLPQRHRSVPLPPHIAVFGPLAGLRLDQAVADQDPVDTHPRRHRAHPGPAQLVSQPQRTPPRMLPPQLTHRRLDLHADLVRARLRAPRAVHQPAQATLLIAADPRMHALTRYAIPVSDFRHRNPGCSIQDRPVPLLDHRQLDQCQSRLPTHDARKRTCDRKADSRHTCKPSGGTAVTSIYRDRTLGLRQ